MIQIIKYEETENDILVGFKKHNFGVYGMIGKEIVRGLTKTQISQTVYEQCKNALDYETRRYLEGKSISIDVSDLEGEEFTPELSKPKTIKLTTDKSFIRFEQSQEIAEILLSTEVRDQYGYDYIGDVVFKTTYGTIIGNKLSLPSVVEHIEVTILAEIGDITDAKKIQLYPYIEPQIVDEPIDDEKVATAEAIIDLDSRLSALEGGK